MLSSGWLASYVGQSEVCLFINNYFFSSLLHSQFCFFKVLSKRRGWCELCEFSCGSPSGFPWTADDTRDFLEPILKKQKKVEICTTVATQTEATTLIHQFIEKKDTKEFSKIVWLCCLFAPMRCAAILCFCSILGVSTLKQFFFFGNIFVDPYAINLLNAFVEIPYFFLHFSTSLFLNLF